MKPALHTPPTPDFAKVHAAVAALESKQPKLTPHAHASIARNSGTRTKPVRMSLSPVDAARRGTITGLNYAAARSSFLTLPTNREF